MSPTFLEFVLDVVETVAGAHRGPTGHATGVMHAAAPYMASILQALDNSGDVMGTLRRKQARPYSPETPGHGGRACRGGPVSADIGPQRVRPVGGHLPGWGSQVPVLSEGHGSTRCGTKARAGL